MSSIIAIFVFIASAQVPSPPAQGAPPPCAVSDDSTYGLTLANPVPIGGGAMWDGFRTLAMASRAAGAAGRTASRPEGGTIVLAYPLSCDGRNVTPIAVGLVPTQGPALAPNGGLVKDGAIAKLLPGTNAPAGSLAARPGDFPQPPLPAGANPAEKRLLQVLIDLDGKLQRVTYVGGPVHLQQAAIEAARTWQAQPARVNGAPVPTATPLEVRFK